MGKRSLPVIPGTRISCTYPCHPFQWLSPTETKRPSKNNSAFCRRADFNPLERNEFRSTKLFLDIRIFMLTYRTFRNSDPPLLANLWQSRAGQPGLLQLVSSDLLEQLVFSRLYFDYNGLHLAFDDGRPVGFAHAGFGRNAEGNWFSTDAGATCLLLVRPDCAEDEVAAGLLDRCEEYFRRRGAKVFYGGGFQPRIPSISACTAAANCRGCLIRMRSPGGLSPRTATGRLSGRCSCGAS